MTNVASRRRIIVAVLFVLAAAGMAGWWCWPTVTPQQLVERGFDAVSRQDWPAVLRTADALTGQSQFVGEEHLFRGVYLLKTGRAVGALKELSQIEPVGEIRELALLAVGEALYQQDQLSNAGRMFATLASEQPGHVEAHRWLAAIAYDLGDMNRAMDELDIVIRLDAKDYRPHLLKAQIQFDLERFAEAAAEYSRAVALHPPELVLEDALTSLARARIANREFEAALETLSQAPQSGVTLALEASCRLSLGDGVAARQLLTKARDIDPEQPDMLRLLGRVELDDGNSEAAIEAFQTVLDQDPADHESRHQFAQALRLSGKSAEADEQARRSTRTIELKSQLSQLTLDAIAHPEDAAVRERMAAVCDEIGKPQLAMMWRKAAAACRQAAAATPAGAAARMPPGQ